MAFSPDGHWIATGSQDGTAKVWDAARGRELVTLKGHTRAISSVCFSPDSQRVVTGSVDSTAKVWSTASGKELVTFNGHAGAISSVAFSMDGRRIVTGGNLTAKVWEAGTPQQVAAWQQEEQAEAERVAAARREQVATIERDRALQSQDPGTIRQWLVLAPIPFQGQNGAVALAEEQIPQEANLRPQAGERVSVGSRELVWSVQRLEDNEIDFLQILKKPSDWSVAYAVCYIVSEADKSEILVKVGSDDQAKIYLNGKEIYRCDMVRNFLVDEDVAAGLELKAGPNVVVFKVVNETAGWFGSLRFTDAAGQPVKGIHVTLTPP